MTFRLAVLVALLAVVVVGNVSLQDMIEFHAFEDFKIKYHKHYSSPQEEYERFKIFQTNLEWSRRMNEIDGGAEYGVTKFSDLSKEEFTHLFLMQLDKNERHPESSTTDPSTVLHTGTWPIDYDWRNYSVSCITPVYNQGQCGSCWAFSATEEIESMCCLAGYPLEQLSMQQIVSCDTTCDVCGGGWPYLAYEYVQRAGGIESYSDYPYTSSFGTTGYCKFDKADIVRDIAGWEWVSHTPKINETNMYAQSWSYGPLSICVDASSWQNYVGGIVTTCGKEIDHCVQLVGWNQQADKGSTVDYWIVRNSWGADWGNAGYIYVEAGKNMCGIAEYATLVWANPPTPAPPAIRL